MNASGTRALNYKPYFDRLASWRFIVVGNAGQVFIGEGAEIISNANWQDIEENE